MKRVSTWMAAAVLAALLVAARACGADAPPKLFLIGGSTMATFPATRPVVGWGQKLPLFFQDPGIVQNRAKSGRSSKSFIDQGLWDAVIGEIRAGDYLIVCFGTNDSADDPARRTEPRGDFKRNLERFIRETRARGATPLLATSVARRNWDEQGRFVEPPSEWVEVTREVAAAAKVPLLEMRQRTVELETRLGREGSIALHLYLPAGRYDAYPKGARDDTHYCDYGATCVAEVAARELQRLKLPIARWLRAGAEWPVPTPAPISPPAAP
ncbi:rhamnogalacturonan acetylesterase [Horticoccus sp. 23ND18S-11]|uniref:rhamnogalacturonan acetylesterase n=1 Tax=Horticoccus sp. 23ND18S-11 TaxID=3391832 RepID=UPI0039C966A4